MFKKSKLEKRILKYLENSTKSLARKILLTAGLATFAFSNLAYSAEQEKEKIKPSVQIEQVYDSQSEQDAPKLIGSVYGEAGFFGGIFEENPAMLNTLIGYNIQNKEIEEMDDGILLFPSARILLKGNKPDYPWGNYGDFGLGVAYVKPPFIIGAEGVYREPFEDEGHKGDFFRLWGGYWSLWRGKQLEEEITPLTEFQDVLWGTMYAGVDYNTLEKNLAADFRAEVNLDVLDIKGFIIGPFAKGKINLDTKNEAWYRYGEVGGGLRIRKGPFHIFFESGYRESFNDRGLEGQYNAIYGGLWFPLK